MKYTHMWSTNSKSTNKYLVAILILAALLRFVGLSNPPVYIFDEVYHAFTAREYLNNHIEAWEWWTTPPKDVAYEWTHPPLAKYGMVIGMYIFGENSFGWRVGSATLGVISILGIYYLVLNITKNKQAALLSAFFVAIEGTHIAQSKIAMNDMYMLCFYIWSLYLAVKSRWKFASVLYGLSLASKWSAIYGLVSLAYLYLYQNPPKNWKLKTSIIHVFFALRCLLISLSVYVLTFAPFIIVGHTWSQWWELHRQMWYYHTHLVATHGYQSTPIQWIFDVRPVWYYVKYGTNLTTNIYVLGNPFILWLGLLALLLSIKKIFTYPYSFLILLYSIFTIPWLFSPRIMFYYHYLPSATFLCVILSVWLSKFPVRVKYLAILLAAICLIIILPMLYPIPMPKNYWDSMFMIFPSWK